VGDCRHEIVLIGMKMDRAKLEQRLDAALLTEQEMKQGPEHWVNLEDPLPSWERTAVASDEE